MLELLTYIGFISSGVLLLLLLLSLIGGLDLDVDIDVDAGGLGILKSVLAFLGFGALTARAMLIAQEAPALALVVGAVAGAVSVWLLAAFLRFLLRQQSNVNYTPGEAMAERGKVYVPIPAGGQGVVTVRIRGTQRELKARSTDGSAIPTGTTVLVEDVEGNVAVVVPEE